MDSPMVILKAVVDMWYRGIPADQGTLNSLPPDAQEILQFLINDMKSVQDFSVAMAAGTMNRELKARGVMANELKHLHDDLRHLAWQAKKVSQGDLKQEITFMGEFSDSFNRLVGNMAEHREKQARELSESRMATIFAMAKLSEARDEDTGHHLERTRSFCGILAEGLGHDNRFEHVINQEFINDLHSASPLHDIGKVAIPDSILLKKGPLDDSEQHIMREHPKLGADTLLAVRHTYPNNRFIDMGIQIARSHHERWDGRGYPDGLSGLAIPLAARIMAIADVYDALRAQRCYKLPFSHEDSTAIIQKGSGTQFDPGIVEVFLEHTESFNQVWTDLRD